MSLVSPTLPSPGDAANASDISTPINQLATVINGGIDDTNISSVSGSKIADTTITTAKLQDSAVTPAKMLGIDLFAATAPIDGGTAPTAGSGQFYIQAGFTTANFPGGGFGANVTFPTPFPNGLLSLTWSYASSSTAFEAARTTNETKTGFTLNSGSAGAQHEICYIAIGW